MHKQAWQHRWILMVAAVLVVCGNFAILWHFEQGRTRPDPNPARNLPLSLNAADVEPPGRIIVGDLDAAPAGVARTGGDVQYFPFSTGPDSTASSETEEEFTEEEFQLAGIDETQARSPLPEPAPQTLAPPQNAAPIFNEGLAEAEIRDAIRHGLPSATDEEREIWYEQLKSLPPGAVRDILRIREQFEGPPLLEEGLPPSASSDAGGRAAALPPDRLLPLGEIRTVIVQNIANAATLGFKRSQVLLRASTTGPRVAAVFIDPTPGRLEPTGRPLDLAIDGGGFFQIQHGDQTAYTRAGAFELGPGQRLQLAFGTAGHVLLPEIAIPETAIAIEVSATGSVVARLAGGDDPVDLGQLELARFLNPSRLERLDSGLLAATASSGAPQRGTPGSRGLGTLRQGFLEQSNADPEHELSELARFERIAAAIEAAGGAGSLASLGAEKPVAAHDDSARQ